MLGFGDIPISLEQHPVKQVAPAWCTDGEWRPTDAWQRPEGLSLPVAATTCQSSRSGQAASSVSLGAPSLQGGDLYCTGLFEGPGPMTSVSILAWA